MDNETREIFAAESAELLSALERSLLTLEREPDNAEAINSAFRAIHTIKGSAGIVDLCDVETFAHTVENVLQDVRAGNTRIDRELTALLLQCRDVASGMIGAWIDDKPVPGDICQARDACADRLVDYLIKDSHHEPAAKTAQSADKGMWHISLRFHPEVLRAGLDPASSIIYANKHLDILSLTAVLDSMPQADAMDPEVCYLGIEMDVRTALDAELIAGLFDLVMEDGHISVLPHGAPAEAYAELVRALPESHERMAAVIASGGAVALEELQAALGIQAGNRPKKASAPKAPTGDIASATIRVDIAKLDALINMVGELVVTGSGITAHARRIGDNALKQSTDMLARLVEDIRASAMSVRMVALHDTLGRLQRTVHDIAHELGKDVKLTVEGGETELDKTVVEKIKDPLMHIIRNSVDHGIESPSERIKKGKPSWGAVIVRAYREAGDVVIDIADDGRGLDRAKLIDKGMAMGLIHRGASPTDGELQALIFEAGFSTATSVTSLSGRGVGMDVVQRNIAEIKGAIEIKNNPGAGLAVSIRIPLTLAIIDGFLVEVGGTQFVLPMETVRECVDLPPGHTGGVDDTGRRYITLRGAALPYVRLREVLSMDIGKRPKTENILIVRHAGNEIGVVVDRLIGGMQVVVKGLGKLYKDIRWASGATIMGDGSVALIVDVPRLMNIVLEGK